MDRKQNSFLALALALVASSCAEEPSNPGVSGDGGAGARLGGAGAHPGGAGASAASGRSVGGSSSLDSSGGGGTTGGTFLGAGRAGSPSTGGEGGQGSAGRPSQAGGPGTGGSNPGGCGIVSAASCQTPEVRITPVRLSAPVIGNGRQTDTEKIPMAIAAIPSGGSRLAWMSSDNRVHIAELDCNDQLIKTPFSLPAYDFQDLVADETGGVIVVTRDAEGGGTLNCGNAANLCIPPNSPIACYDLWMVRFDTAGNEVWATKLTSSSSASPPYSANNGANHFIWWYQHHTRLASDGSNTAAYFGDAITVRNGSCVDIHQGDRMQVVGPDGQLLSGRDSFAGGCSHSWTTRIVWDHRTSHFVMVCATDNNMRVARPAPYRTILATPQGQHNIGDLILAGGSGYWVTVNYENTVRLLHFEEATPDQDIKAASSDFSHLVSYGKDQMIVAWSSGSSLSAQVRDARDGSVVSEPFSIAVPDHRYQSFKAYPDGSVAFPAQGTDSLALRVARVLSCGD